MTGRSTPEWIGSSPDAKVPPRVKIRIFEKHNGRCYLSGRKINAGDKWELEHIIALCNGGEHRETNMAPALSDEHKKKTKADRAEKKKTDAIRKRHLGIRAPSKFACSRDSKFKKKLNGQVVLR